MAAIPDYSIGFSQAELEEILDELKIELKRTISSYSESGTQVIAQKTEDIHAKLAAVQKALQKKDPATYGTSNRTAVSKVHNILDR